MTRINKDPPTRFAKKIRNSPLSEKNSRENI